MIDNLQLFSTGKIYRWDSVQDISLPKPFFYFNPTPEELEVFRKNNYILPVKVKNTGCLYDNTFTWGILKPSSLIPNCRPNFFNKTGYYTITLRTLWAGYPDNLGEYEIYTSDNLIDKIDCQMRNTMAINKCGCGNNCGCKNCPTMINAKYKLCKDLNDNIIKENFEVFKKCNNKQLYIILLILIVIILFMTFKK